MTWVDRLLTCNLRVTHYVIIRLHRLTPLGRLVALLATGSVLYWLTGLVGLRRSGRVPAYYPREGEYMQYPVMNYALDNGTVSPAYEDTQAPTTTAIPTTTLMMTTQKPHVTQKPSRRRKRRHDHHHQDTIHQHEPSHGPPSAQLTENRDDPPQTVITRDASPQTRPTRKNVLFLMADDLRAQIGSYFGEDSVTSGDTRRLYTPHMDKLAAESLVLKRAYCQYSLCGPSRSSMLTSRSPDSTKVYQNHVYWRESAGPYTTLPEYFKERGYKTYSIGKIFHIQGHHHNHDPVSWSGRPYVPPKVRHIKDVRANWVSVSEQERQAYPLEDERLVAHAVKVLTRLKKRSRKSGTETEPFFMAVGFYRPHVPMICPEEFFRLYPLEAGPQYMSDPKWQTPKYEQFQKMAPFEEGTTSNAHLRNIPDMPLRYLRRSYFACVSYIDKLIGVLLKALDDLNLRNSTVVSLVADHGFHLGENNVVSKYTNHEVALRVPMMVRVPGLTDGGVASRALVELLDVFPTIAAAAGVPPPPPCGDESTTLRLCTEGRNLLPLVSNPDLTLHSAVFSQIYRGRDMMEYTVRTDRIRYTDYATYRRYQLPNNKLRLEIDWNVNLGYSVLERKLYDYARDPEERFNLYHYEEYSQYRTVLKDLLKNRFKVVDDLPIGIY